MAEGIVKWFNSQEGYGLINVDETGDQVFVHYSAISSGGFGFLEKDQRVHFDIAQGPYGPQAENVWSVSGGPLEGPGGGGGDDRPRPR